MSADLDTLNDAQLSEVFAVEVAGWAKSDHSGWWFRRGVCMHKRCVEFATSADAVLPFAERYNVVDIQFNAVTRLWQVTLGIGAHRGVASTLPKAIAIALLRGERAKRAENGGRA